MQCLTKHAYGSAQQGEKPVPNLGASLRILLFLSLALHDLTHHY